MARTASRTIRVDEDLLEAVKIKQGLADDTTLGVVIRLALAIAGGRDTTAAYLPLGRRPRNRTT